MPDLVWITDMERGLQEVKHNMNLTLKPEEIRFSKRCIRISDPVSGTYRVPYKEIVSAWLSVRKESNGGIIEPDISEITDRMGGDLFLYDIRHSCWKIQTGLTGRTGGALLLELAFHAPYILLGGQNWIDLDDENDFAQAGRMVELMRGD